MALERRTGGQLLAARTGQADVWYLYALFDLATMISIVINLRSAR